MDAARRRSMDSDVLEELVQKLEKADDIEPWLCTHMPVATDFVNLVTVERFVERAGIGTHGRR